MDPDSNQEQKAARITLTQRVGRKADDVMANKLNMGKKSRTLVLHYSDMLWEQLRAMLPITLLQVSQGLHMHGTQTPIVLICRSRFVSTVS